MNEKLEKAVKILEQGGIVIFPTDTAFGIGCRVDKEESIKKLYKIRKRPKEKAVSLLLDTVKMAEKYVQKINREVLDKLIEPYWPGALTIVLKAKKENVPALVRGGGETVGLRIPNHQVPRFLIRSSGVAILGPSANFAGEATPYKYEDLDKELLKLVDFVIPGESKFFEPSTFVDATQETWKILREGAVKLKL